MLVDKPKLQSNHEVVFDNQWFKVKQTPGGFTYGERKGVNSVAFILISKDDNDPKPYGVVNEFKDPINEFVTSAFGGSIDLQEYKNDLEHLVQDEVAEESGFTVDTDEIWYLGKVFISTQMNQYVHLFFVYVDKALQGKKTTTNPTELRATVQWLDGNQVTMLEDWKAVTILSKRLVQEL